MLDLILVVTLIFIISFLYNLFILLNQIETLQMYSFCIIWYFVKKKLRSQSWWKGTKCECTTDWLRILSLLDKMKYIFTFLFSFFALVPRQSTALSSAAQHAMPPELGGEWGMECFNMRFPLPTLLCAGHSVKLIFLPFL